MLRTIEITFTDAATVQIEALGFQGNACEKATADYIKALGTGSHKKKKPEYYAKATTQNQQRA